VKKKIQSVESEEHDVDICVVGGGMAGLIAALSAARGGATVVLVQDRPVLGGNASSEVRMHICGAQGEHMRETGILEELILENHYRNPQPNYSIWDSVLYGATVGQERLKLLLNCSVNDLDKAENRITAVHAWQLTTETMHTIRAALFVDASGDGILAPLSGAEYRIGREASAEFDESIAPLKSDSKTMGMSCLFQAREYDRPMPFTPPDWAHKFRTPEDLNGRCVDLVGTNFWWMEVGGEHDSIHDTETLRDELLKIAFGVFDYIKNYSPDREQYANWALDWQGFLPGKRESRRYIGDHVLTQNDVEAEGRFDDIVAYGGWTMDDHYPAGFYHPKKGTIFHPAPSPYGIPFRTLYSRNIENLFCAGRCHSATHAAMSSTRVMATTSLMGQAVGTAAALAVRHGTSPRGISEAHMAELQQNLMDDDCYLPWKVRAIAPISAAADLSADAESPEPLRNGVDRPVGDLDNGWRAPLGTPVTYAFSESIDISMVRIVFDSDLNRRSQNMRYVYLLDAELWQPPETLVRAFRIETQFGDGTWKTVHHERNNYQRLVRIPLSCNVMAIRLICEATWGSDSVHVFAFEVS
jgi:hypothetical protein